MIVKFENWWPQTFAFGMGIVYGIELRVFFGPWVLRIYPKWEEFDAA